MSGHYDITYTTTDKGRGCGGKLYNYGGRFTSPFYPSEFRNDTECTWDVSVPRGLTVVLQFSIFDLGARKNCDSNLKIYNVGSDGERVLMTTYCGGDNPATFHSLGSDVSVTYKSNVNNGGIGWVIVFMASNNFDIAEGYNSAMIII